MEETRRNAILSLPQTPQPSHFPRSNEEASSPTNLLWELESRICARQQTSSFRCIHDLYTNHALRMKSTVSSITESTKPFIICDCAPKLILFLLTGHPLEAQLRGSSFLSRTDQSRMQPCCYPHVSYIFIVQVSEANSIILSFNCVTIASLLPTSI